MVMQNYAENIFLKTIVVRMHLVNRFGKVPPSIPGRFLPLGAQW